MALVFQSLRGKQLEQLSVADEALLIENARVLRDARESEKRSLFLGKNLCFLCDSFDGADAALFRDAALSLGARLSCVRPSLSRACDAHTLRDTARLLARLYDAIECRGLPARMMRDIAGEAAFPVYDGISSSEHPTAALAAMMEAGSNDTRRLSILQAVLVGTIG